MNFNEYQEATAETAIYPKEKEKEYLILGLCSEIGEIAGKYKKEMRDKKIVDAADMSKEIGDLEWYIARLASAYNLKLEDIAKENIAKLQDRKRRGVIQGSGDNR